MHNAAGKGMEKVPVWSRTLPWADLEGLEIRNGWKWGRFRLRCAVWKSSPGKLPSQFSVVCLYLAKLVYYGSFDADGCKTTIGRLLTAIYLSSL